MDTEEEVLKGSKEDEHERFQNQRMSSVTVLSFCIDMHLGAPLVEDSESL